MKDFGSILHKGKKIFKAKDKGGIWKSRCEECNARAKLYEYIDEEKQIWLLCEQCLTIFVNGEEE